MKLNKELVEKTFGLVVASVEENVNTNNAWGFGGAVKTVFRFASGYSFHTGRAYYRHLPSHRFANVRNPHGAILFEGSLQKCADFLRGKIS